MKENYYYIDESGHILSDETLFIHGCIKTDTPNMLTEILEEVKAEIQNDFYFNDFMKKFKKTGFHAVDNHFDIRTALYRRLLKLNWRAYFVIVDKESEYYKSIAEKNEHEIFMISLTKLIHDRIIKRKEDKNIFIFETIQLTPKSLEKNLEEYFNKINEKYNCEHYVVQKDGDINLAIIDYLNYILYRILTTNNEDAEMRRRFKLFSSKIAMIHIQHSKKYLSRFKDEITIDNLIKNW